MKIGCDLDNVVVDIMAGAKSAIARDHDLPVSEIIETHIYWSPFSHRDPEIAAKLVPPRSFWDREDVLLYSPIVPRSLEAVWRLYEADLLSCFITRRPPHVSALTRQWMRRNLFPELPIEHVGSVDEGKYFAVCKSTICQKYGVTHMIDDLADEAIALSQAGIEILLIDAAIGREARREFLKSNPTVPLYPDALAAAEFAIDFVHRKSLVA